MNAKNHRKGRVARARNNKGPGAKDRLRRAVRNVVNNRGGRTGIKAKAEASSKGRGALKIDASIPRREKTTKIRTSATDAIATENRMAKFSSENIENELSGRRVRSNVSVPDQSSVKAALESFFDNSRAVEYLKKNVSKHAADVVGMLGTPKTDEYIAEQLGMKINAIRRILNIMQGYGLTNYYISKNTNGWLSFSWYINTSKVPTFLAYVDDISSEKPVVTDSCNDYFVCNSCYKNNEFVFTFDDAFDAGFKCACGNNLAHIEKTTIAGRSTQREPNANNQETTATTKAKQ